MTTKSVRELLHEIIDLPVEVMQWKITGANHVKFHLRHAGETRFFVTSGTPSDVRSRRNFRGEVHRWIKQIGEKNA